MVRRSGKGNVWRTEVNRVETMTILREGNRYVGECKVCHTVFECLPVDLTLDSAEAAPKAVCPACRSVRLVDMKVVEAGQYVSCPNSRHEWEIRDIDPIGRPTKAI